MLPPVHSTPVSAPERRGAALLLSLFVLIVILAVAYQIKISTSTDARVARNDEGITRMDLAIESILLDYFETLRTDAESGAAGGASGPGEAAGLLGGAAGGGDGGGDPGAGGGEGEGPSDSRRDDWARTRRLEINGVELEIRVQPENSKINVLSMLTGNEDEATKAFERVARVIDLCRDGTEGDIDRHDARDMAEAMLDHMRDRKNSVLPMPELVTFDEEAEDIGLPLTLREFAALEPFEPHHFQDYRDEDDNVVHSLESFLTVLSSLQTRQEFEQAEDDEPGAGGGGSDSGDEGAEGEDAAEGEGGGGSGIGGGGQVGSGGRQIGGAEAAAPPGGVGADLGGQEAASIGHRININFAPRAVLFALMDDNDVPSNFWDDIVEHRNTEDEEASGSDDNDDDPILDEFGEEVVPYLFFASPEDLGELDDWNQLEPIVQTEITDLVTTESDVFSIVVTARRATGVEGGDFDWTDRDAAEERRESGSNLIRVVRCTVWRVASGAEVDIVPLERWETLDHLVYDVLDFPDEDR